MSKNERPRDHRGDDTDTVIERMEAQFEFERDRPPVVADTLGELQTYLEPHLGGFDAGISAYRYLTTPLANAEQARWWHRSMHVAEPQRPAQVTYRQTVERLRAAVAREALSVVSVTESTGSSSSEVVKEHANRVSAERRHQFELDAEYVLRRLSLLFSGRQGEIWLNSFNHHLGTRPVDVLVLGATSEVIGAIELEEQGAL